MPNKILHLIYNKLTNEISFSKEAEKIDLQLEKDTYLSNSSIKLPLHEPEFLTKMNYAGFSEPTNTSILKAKPFIDTSWEILKKITPDFCSYIERTTREIFLYTSADDYSRATFSQFGAAFINIQQEPNDEVYYI